MNKAGIVFCSSIMLGYMHKQEHLDLLLGNLEKIFIKLSEFNNYKDVLELIKGEIIAPRAVRNT